MAQPRSRKRLWILLGLLAVMVGLCAASAMGMIVFPWVENIESSTEPGAGQAWSDSVEVQGKYGREVDFHAYVPRPRRGSRSMPGRGRGKKVHGDSAGSPLHCPGVRARVQGVEVSREP